MPQQSCAPEPRPAEEGLLQSSEACELEQAVRDGLHTVSSGL